MKTKTTAIRSSNSTSTTVKNNSNNNDNGNTSTPVTTAVIPSRFTSHFVSRTHNMDRQYIHQKALAFIRFAPNGVVWVNNRLQAKANPEAEREMEHLWTSFQDFCRGLVIADSIVHDVIDTVLSFTHSKR